MVGVDAMLKKWELIQFDAINYFFFLKEMIDKYSRFGCALEIIITNR